MNAIEVNAWRCQVCTTVYESRAEADKCCACKCGKPVEKYHGLHGDQCAGCQWKSNLRHSRANVKSLSTRLADARASLEELEKKKPGTSLARRPR